MKYGLMLCFLITEMNIKDIEMFQLSIALMILVLMVTRERIILSLLEQVQGYKEERSFNPSQQPSKCVKIMNLLLLSITDLRRC